MGDSFSKDRVLRKQTEELSPTPKGSPISFGHTDVHLEALRASELFVDKLLLISLSLAPKDKTHCWNYPKERV